MQLDEIVVNQSRYVYPSFANVERASQVFVVIGSTMGMIQIGSIVGVAKKIERRTVEWEIFEHSALRHTITEKYRLYPCGIGLINNNRVENYRLIAFQLYNE